MNECAKFVHFRTEAVAIPGEQQSHKLSVVKGKAVIGRNPLRGSGRFKVGWLIGRFNFILFHGFGGKVRIRRAYVKNAVIYFWLWRRTFHFVRVEFGLIGWRFSCFWSRLHCI